MRACVRACVRADGEASVAPRPKAQSITLTLFVTYAVASGTLWRNSPVHNALFPLNAYHYYPHNQCFHGHGQLPICNLIMFPVIPIFLQFLFPILWCCHTGDHPPRDLATFGFRPAMKVENLFNSYILATCLNNVQKRGEILENFCIFSDFFLTRIFHDRNFTWERKFDTNVF